MPRPVSHQLTELRRMGRPWVLLVAMALFALPAIYCVWLAFAKREIGFAFAAALLGFFASLIWAGAPHVRRAIAGIDSPDCAAGQVRIWIEEGSESVDYMARVSAPARDDKVWTFQFRPQGWTPQAGEFVADCRYVAEVDWPVLVLTEAGLLFPCQNPQGEA